MSAHATSTAAGSTIRALGHDELLAYEPLLCEWLIGAPGHSLLTTYPQVFQPDAGTIGFGAFVDDELQSHAAVRRVTLESDRGPVRTSLIGVVATRPNARGAHLASTLLQHVATREANAAQDLILLWSDHWDFYAKLGYALCGVQAELEYCRPSSLRQADRVSTAADTVRPCRPDDIPALTAIHASKLWRIHRDEREMHRTIREIETFTFVLDRDSAVQAYACCKKGLDFDGWWHELGGADHDVAIVLDEAMRALDQSAATIVLPPYREQLFEHLAPHCGTVREGAVALAKPLTEQGICDFFVDGLDSI